MLFVFCFKQKTAYEMRISDWSSDVCSSDLQAVELLDLGEADVDLRRAGLAAGADQLGQAVQGLRTEHQVDVGRALHDRLAFLRGHAAADADDHGLAVGLERLPPAQLAEHLLLRLFADRAGVDQHHRSEERRVGKECVSKCRTRWAPIHEKEKKCYNSELNHPIKI